MWIRRCSLGLLTTAAVVLAACGSDGETTDIDTGSSAHSTTAPTTAAPATTATPEPAPLPALVTRQRIVITGIEEIVFDWTTDQCEPEHIPDIAARAYRDADGQVNLTIGHYVTYRMTGPSLDALTTDCSTVQLASDYDPDPAQFNDSEWIGSVHTADGRTIYAVAHNEYRGDTHSGVRPGQCPSGQRLPCLDTSFTMQISTDGGDTFDDIAPPPGHLIATLPYTYRDDTVPSGIRQPSNIVEGPDGFFYLFGNVSDQPDQEQWVCAMRTDDLDDPSSWRYWDGTDFAGVWKNPYLEPADPDDDKCAPLARSTLGAGVQEGIVFDERLQRFVAVGVAAHPTATEPNWGVYVSTSEDLVDWTAREFLLSVPVTPTVADPDNETMYAYPTIIDPDSPSMSFGTSDGEMYLYMSRFNFGGNSLDRDLVRWPIAVEDYTVPAPDWTFDDEADITTDAGGWGNENDLEVLSIADGVLQLNSTGTDPFLSVDAVTIPAGYDRLVIRMQVPGGEVNTAQLFFTTDDDLRLDEAKSILFDVGGTDEFVEYEIDLSAHPEWDGTIRTLRIDPVEGIIADARIDRIWFPTADG